MNARWRTYLSSPLVRNPRLAARKIRDRLAGPVPIAWTSPPPDARLRYPPRLADRLRAWAVRCPLDSRPFSSARVFGQDFDREELLALCRQGPRKAKDLTGDIKLIWEFSRGYAHALNALRSARAPEEIAREIGDWLAANDNPSLPAWSCPMDVAIRAVNHICADALVDGKISRALGENRWTSDLWNAGRLIEHRLEARLVSSNHYLADLLGLWFIGSSFPDNPRARRWARFAGAEFPAAVRAQTYPDGGLCEASLPYHALVTEMVLLFLALADRPPASAFLDRAARMVEIVARMADADGDVFQVGDNDSGRILPLDFVAGPDCGRSGTIRALASVVLGKEVSIPREDCALYPDSGWWIARRAIWTALLETGGVGMAGFGGHAHNDMLSICVNDGDRRVFVDPGSYLYTPDTESRDAFRSSRAHNTVTVDDREFHPIRAGSADDLFLLPGPARGAGCLAEAWSVTADFAYAGCRIRRRVEMEEHAVRISDEVTGRGTHAVTWRFHLAPGLAAEADGDVTLVRGNGTRGWRFTGPGGTARMRMESGWYSPVYGTRVPIRVLVASVNAALPATAKWRLERL
jgi:hypothetical protein